MPGLVEVIETLLETTFAVVSSDRYEAEVQRAVQSVVVDRLIRLASVAPMRAVSAYWLEDLVRRIDEVSGPSGLGGVEGRAHVDTLRRDIRRFLDRPGGIAEPWEAPAVPPVSPTGDPGLRWLGEPFCSEPFLVTGW